MKKTSKKSKTKKTSPKRKVIARKPKAKQDLCLDAADLRLRLDEAEATLSAIRRGEVDALIVSGPGGDQVYTLKGAEQPYRILVESMNEGALTLTDAGVIMNCNKAFADMTGMSCGMLTGRSLGEFVSKKDAARFSVFWKQAVENEAKTEIELQFDNRFVSAYLSSRARVIEGERWLFAVVTDITERKRTEAELDKYRQGLEKLVDERTGELQTANEELQAVNEELRAANEELLRSNDELAVKNRELDLLNSEIDAFVYSVSHDLRAPLRTMEGFAKIVSEDYADKLDAEGKAHLIRIRNGSERLSRLIEDLLRLSRISRQNLDRVDYDLSGIAAAVMRGLKDAEPARNVEVVIGKDMRAVVDPHLMRIALTNLLENAWKFTSKCDKARIEFGVMSSGFGDKKQVRSSEQKASSSELPTPNPPLVYFVKDNGVGFDPAFVAKIFQPFQRLHTEQEFEGTGIGLAIVDRIIKKHGGRIWAEGAVGQGATIYFTL